MRCSNCKSENRSGVKFCEECGQPLPQPAEVKVQKTSQLKTAATVPCPACGHANWSGIKFCEECGKELSGDPLQLTVLTCISCGHQNQPDMRFCEECGKPLQEKSATVKPARVPGAPSRLRFNVRGCLIAGGILMLIAIAVIAVMAITPEVSRSEAVAASNSRIQALYPGTGNTEPVVQTNRTDGNITYRIEYQTDTGKIIFVVDAETGETFMMGIR